MDASILTYVARVMFRVNKYVKDLTEMNNKGKKRNVLVRTKNQIYPMNLICPSWYDIRPLAPSASSTVHTINSHSSGPSSLSSTITPWTESCFACFIGAATITMGAVLADFCLCTNSAIQYCSSRAARRSLSNLASSSRRSVLQNESAYGRDSQCQSKDLASMKILGSFVMYGRGTPGT